MKKLLSVLLILAMILSLASCGDSYELIPNDHNNLESGDVGYTVAELTEAMGLGWNLGNTLDAPEGETAWGQPETTKAMFDKLKELGFNTVRVPVSWGKHTSGAPDYTIDDEWMNRVEEVVNYGLDNDMFIIINSHHDNDYYYPSKAHEEESLNYIEKIWTQIAERFKDYDQHLIFQSMNEPRLTGTNYEWWLDENNQQCVESLEVIMKMNQKFLDVVRASGSRNSDRFLLLVSYCGSNTVPLSAKYSLPEDTVEGRLLLSVHAYSPYNFAFNGDTSFRSFGNSEKRDIDYMMTQLYNRYNDMGVGIIIDEMGAINKNNPYDRQDWGAYFVAKAKSLGMVCVWWDNGSTGTGEESFGLFDRRNLEVFSVGKSVYDGMMIGLETPLDEIVPSKPE